MQKQFRPVLVLGGARTPFVRSFSSYMRVSNQDLLTASLKSLATQHALQGQRIGDVALGAIMQNSADWNLARESVLGTGLHPDTPAYNVQRACGTGLEATWQIALKIAAGQIESGIAGGSDTNSDLPVLFPREFAAKLMELRMAKGMKNRMGTIFKFRLRDVKPQFPAVVEPRTGLSMGEHCEKMVQEWKITREAQDQLAFESHQKAAKAYDEGFYNDLVFEFKGVKKDLILRKDTTVEKLAKLRPVFDTSGKGTLTAGNSTALTDGGSVALLGSEAFAQQLKLTPLARFIDAEAAALDFVSGAGLLMAPTIAVSRLLERNQLSLQDFDFYEIHEAFAGQVLCTLKAWESADYCAKALGRKQALGSVDRNKMNIKGGSVAVGHAFGATGARIVAGLGKILHQAGGKKRGLISICTGGGMGVAAIMESY